MKLTTYFGKSIEGSYERYLEESGKAPIKPQTTAPLQGIDEGDYIFMPKHNLHVAKQRSHFDSNWNQAHQALHNEGLRMLTIREFVDFLSLLKNGNDEFKGIYNEITEVRKFWRAEWLDADFKVVNDLLHINYNHRIVNGSLQPQNSEPLEDCLMEGCKIDLESFNRQGLPIKKGNSFFYWFPMSDNNSVAGFFAGSGGTGLFCRGGPRDSGSELGVRRAREKIKV